MDSSEKPPNVLSLCSGYGGIELGLKRALGAINILVHVEIEAFAVANLVNKMETGQMVPAPIWTDIKTFDPKPFRDCVDILTGGYPCQPFSAAGKRNGEDDPRHLWPYIRSIIFYTRPRKVFFENVEGHLTLGISEVLEDLEKMGYRCEVGIFSAVEVGAPHQRKRVFILANSRSGTSKTGTKRTGRKKRSDINRRSERPELDNSENQNGRLSIGENQENTLSFLSGKWPARPGCTQFEWEEPRILADSGSKKQQGIPQPERWKENSEAGKSGWGWETKPKLGRTIDGAGHRVDRLRLLGNGVVPQVAEKAYLILSEKLNL